MEDVANLKKQRNMRQHHSLIFDMNKILIFSSFIFAFRV